ncbi:MAG: lysylphosphatidylglycerol synthase transmembrane domain-containing protein [Pseudomonadota bacterium]
MQAGKNILINVLKMTFVALLLWWMAASGRLSWSQMAIILNRPDALAASVAVWLFGPVLLGTARWWLLMRGAGLKCGYFRAMKLQLVGFFFNTAMPGAVGGDIIKAIYIMREQPAGGGKTPAMLSVLLDRIVGLIGLFVMGVVAAGFSYRQLVSNPVTAQLMSGLALVVLLSAVFLGLVFLPYPDGRDPFKKILSQTLPGFSVLHGIYEALRSYRKKPGILISTIMISVFIQVIFLFFMGFIGRIMYGSDAFDQTLLAPIFPFGILITAIPLAPGGLGVGHAAFDKLFALVGLPGGANVFNAYVLSQLLLNFLGIIPYLSMKTSIAGTSPDQVQVI